MAGEKIKYRKGNYKYQLHEAYSVTVGLHPEEDIDSPMINLSVNGELLIKKGYAWDGPSGPSIDTPNFMRGSMVHDALYQLMRRQPDILPNDDWRKSADDELRRICREDGMGRFRAWYIYRAVRWKGFPATEPENISPVLEAP